MSGETVSTIGKVGKVGKSGTEKWGKPGHLKVGHLKVTQTFSSPVPSVFIRSHARSTLPHHETLVAPHPHHHDRRRRIHCPLVHDSDTLCLRSAANTKQDSSRHLHSRRPIPRRLGTHPRHQSANSRSNHTCPDNSNSYLDVSHPAI